MGFRDYTEIVFEAGNILSVQMLEETYRYPRDFLQLSHVDYSNGIVAGLDFFSQNNDVYLSAGIVKFNEKYYILPQNVNLDEWLKQHSPALISSVEYCLCLACEDVLSDKDKLCGIRSHSRLKLHAEKEMSKDTLHLAKYKFRSDTGIHLPRIKVADGKNPFEDFFQSGLLQLLECEYGHPLGKTTYHPVVFRAIRDYLEQKNSLSPYDFSLLMEIQNHGIAALSSLRSYVACAKKEESLHLQDMTREELFRSVTECVQLPYVPAVHCEHPTEQKKQSVKKRPVSKLI